MTIPAVLGPIPAGARVALVAPSGPAPTERLDDAVRLLSSWGYRPVGYPSTRARHPRADYLAGEDRVRAEDVQDAWCDADIAGIVCVRGGYGSVRILDLLDADAMRAARPKPIFGSSDVTALHEWVRERLGAPGWFTPMPATRDLLDDPAATAALRVALTAGLAERSWTADAARTLIAGEATGTLIGGNLSLLAATLGARTRPRVDNAVCIALLEDVGEELYRLDGYLTALLRAGWFDGVAGVALGSWRDCGPVAAIEALALEALGPLGVPLVSELGFGHGPAAHSLPLGVPATLKAGDRPTLWVRQPATSPTAHRTG